MINTRGVSTLHFTPHLQANDEPYEAKYPAEEQQSDDRKHDIVGRLDLHKHSLDRAGLCHNYRVALRMSAIAVARLGWGRCSRKVD